MALFSNPVFVFVGLAVGTLCTAVYIFNDLWYLRTTAPSMKQTAAYRIVSGITTYGFLGYILGTILLWIVLSLI